ncbi:MAG: nucleolar 14 family protein, partial [Pseudobdellovibrionaceae bacterium]|nr:nucleolar 14 family protein [Pseudobdellovibrionaceae bacterium]
PKPKPADDELSAGDDLSDDFGLDDEPAKPAKKATAISDELSDFGLDDDDKPAKKAAASSDDLADDFELDDEPKKAPQKKAKAAADVDDDLLGETPDLSLDDEKPEPLGADDQELGDLNFGDEDKAVDDEIGIEKSDEPGELAEDLNFGAEASDDDIDSLLDEPAPASSHAGKDLLGFGDGPSKPHYESTRMAQKPDLESKPDELDDDLSALEFADDDDETSVSLRKAVHEDGVVPEFNDPNFDGEAEDTRIDLHAPVEDDLQFEDDEETNIKLHPAPEKKPGKPEPTFHKGDDDPLDGLAMGFDNDDVIDEPAIGNLAADADLDDIPIEAPAAAPARAGGRTTPSLVDNGSLASLTATAKANEALLRMSLCFDRSTALEIAREYLPQISATGCLVDIGKTTETLATWRSGAESAAKGKAAAFQRMAKAAKSGQWSEIPVQAQDDLFGSVKTVSVYKIQKDDGRILLLVGDYPVEDESLREALTSFAEQLGSK